MPHACKFFALIGFAVLTACAPPPDTARFQHDFAKGTAAYDAGDFETARRYWQPLADNYDLAALRNMGHLYRRGLGVEQDFKKALGYYETAAKRGFAPAMVNAAMLHLSNDGLAYAPDKADAWLARAAAQGYAPAIELRKARKMRFQLFDQ